MNVFSYSPNNLNQYTSVGGISYGYDGNGKDARDVANEDIVYDRAKVNGAKAYWEMMKTNYEDCMARNAGIPCSCPCQ